MQRRLLNLLIIAIVPAALLLSGCNRTKTETPKEVKTERGEENTAAQPLQLRGILIGVDLSDAATSAEARETAIKALRMAVANDITRVFAVVQSWPAENTGRDFEQDVLPVVRDNCVAILQAVPQIEEFGIEYLIPPEQEHVNTLTRTRQIVAAVHAQLGGAKRRIFVVPDSAHTYGLVPKEQWASITAELAEACENGEVVYAHLSVPESRSDKILDAVRDGSLPFEQFVGALKKAPNLRVVALEAFNPQDPALPKLAEMVPKFAAADASGWTEGHRFARMAEAAVYLAAAFKGEETAPMVADVMVRRGFNSLAKCDAEGNNNPDGDHFAYVDEATRQWRADENGHFRELAIGLAPDNPEEFTKLCKQLRAAAN